MCCGDGMGLFGGANNKPSMTKQSDVDFSLNWGFDKPLNY